MISTMSGPADVRMTRCLPRLQYVRRTRRCYASGVNSAKGTCVFLVRMWLHGGEPEAGGTWRGSIQDVESGRIFYLADTRDVAEFIDARLSERAKSGFESPGDSE